MRQLAIIVRQISDVLGRCLRERRSINRNGISMDSMSKARAISKWPYLPEGVYGKRQADERRENNRYWLAARLLSYEESVAAWSGDFR